jgi:hypothetical protein
VSKGGLSHLRHARSPGFLASNGQHLQATNRFLGTVHFDVEVTMSSSAHDSETHRSLELPIEELFRRARPLPPYEETVIADLTDDEEREFFAAIDAS